MSYKIIGKYIKNLNFSIPNPRTFFLLAKDIENYKINIDIKSNQVKQNIIEVLESQCVQNHVGYAKNKQKEEPQRRQKRNFPDLDQKPSKWYDLI